jgi:hypothetical protein
MSDKKEVTLIDLLQAVGVDNLTYQTLGSSLTGNQKTNKDGSVNLTFITHETLYDVVVARKREALIIWADRDVLVAAHKKLREEQS